MDKLLQNGFSKIITGKVQFSTTLLPMNMTLTRFIAKYKASPTPATLSECLSQIDPFIEKYKAMLSGDLDKIARL